ncbi:hypothetical protein H3C61_04570 [Candidatus Gracilibacteria bacterium]|nr:hypothetical protein [Candidatus Gracilibacteria bacterium]
MSKNDNFFGPRKIGIVDILMHSAGGFTAGFIGSVLLLFIVLSFGGLIDLPSKIGQVSFTMGGNSPIFPFALSFITFIVSIIVVLLTYYFLTIIDQEKYKKTIIHFSQLAIFSIIIYILFITIYVVVGVNNYDYIMYVFIFHILILTFGSILILELLNNYRYILLGIYSSFFGFGIASILILFIFSMFGSSYAKLLSLLLMLPLSVGLLLFFKGLFEFLYYKYFIITGKDQLGDIFEQIKQEEIDLYNENVAENNTY